MSLSSKNTTSLTGKSETAPLLAWQVQRRTEEQNRLLKKGIWAYFILLIFEGALRKWVLPGLSTPLLLIRDPIAAWLVIIAWQRQMLPSTTYLTGMVTVGILGIFTAIFFGHGNLMVALYGARILVFHFPLIFVMGRLFTRQDVIYMGKVIVAITIPMTVLIALQFFSPQSAWVNRGVGGDSVGAGFSGALGFFRPPATFSFTNGTSLFYSLAACFIIYFWISPSGINRIVHIAATGGLLAAIPLSISRGLFFQVCVSILFVFAATLRKPKYIGSMIMAVIGAVFAITLLSHTSFFQTATGAFFSRFDMANEVEGGVKGVFLDRYLGGMLGALSGLGSMPFFGYGLGMGTNVGSMLLSGDIIYLISEGEWGRLIGEMGAVMGLTVIALRIGFMVKISAACYRRLAIGDLLPWMLLSFGLLTVPQSQWGQPTALGFSTLIAGLMIASLKTVKRKSKPVAYPTPLAAKQRIEIPAVI